MGFRVESFEAKKMMKKKSERRLPRRETRTPVRRDFREEFVGMGPARLRSSFGWAGGLFALRVTRRGRLKAWRLGGLEAWRPGEKKHDFFVKVGAEG